MWCCKYIRFFKICGDYCAFMFTCNAKILLLDMQKQVSGFYLGTWCLKAADTTDIHQFQLQFITVVAFTGMIKHNHNLTVIIKQ